MNGSAKRLTAIIMVTAMIASAMVIVFTDEQDSSADVVDCKTYYYDQLETDLAKNAYTGIAGISSFGGSTNVEYSPSDLAAIAEMGEGAYLSSEIAKAFDALRFDRPDILYWTNGYSTSAYGDKVIITPTVFDTGRFTGEKSSYDDNISSWLGGISISGTGYEKIKNAHNYVSSHLNYDDDGASESATEQRKGNTRSVYNALDPSYSLKQDGRNLVVCEGYAKMFKVLCDHLDIPCIIVTGMSNDGTKTGAHMWNYVLYNEKWFLVDCTWDCNESGDPYKIYLLAGTSKSNGTISVGESHDPCGITDDYVFYETFSMPALSALSVNDGGSIEGGTQHLVTFMNGSSVYRSVYVKEGESVSAPDEPTGPIGWNFVEWRLEGSEERYDFGPVTADLTVVAYGVYKEVYKLKYDTVNGTNVQSTVVVKPDGEGNPPVDVEITKNVPVKQGFKFKEWNTSKDGKGVTYNPGDKVTLVGDATLYAVWEDTSSVSDKIDNLVGKAAEFLSKETIPGVSNLLLTIGVITTVISLLAVAAIARK